MATDETAAAVAVMLRRLLRLVEVGELTASPGMVRRMGLAASTIESPDGH